VTQSISWPETTFKYLSNGIKIIFLGAIGAEIWTAEGTGLRKIGQTLTTHISMTTQPKIKKNAIFIFVGHKNCAKFQVKIRVGDVVLN